MKRVVQVCLICIFGMCSMYGMSIEISKTKDHQKIEAITSLADAVPIVWQDLRVLLYCVEQRKVVPVKKIEHISSLVDNIWNMHFADSSETRASLIVPSLQTMRNTAAWEAPHRYRWNDIDFIKGIMHDTYTGIVQELEWNCGRRQGYDGFIYTMLADQYFPPSESLEPVTAPELREILQLYKRVTVKP